MYDDINNNYFTGHTPLMLAADWGGNTEIVRALLDNPDIDINAEDDYGKY